MRTGRDAALAQWALTPDAPGVARRPGRGAPAYHALLAAGGRMGGAGRGAARDGRAGRSTTAGDAIDRAEAVLTVRDELIAPPRPPRG